MMCKACFSHTSRGTASVSQHCAASDVSERTAVTVALASPRWLRVFTPHREDAAALPVITGHNVGFIFFLCSSHAPQIHDFRTEMRVSELSDPPSASSSQ